MTSCIIKYDDTNDILKWDIDYNIIEELLKFLNLNNECGGELFIDTEQKKIYKLSKIHGDKDSVITPKAIINYHSHPASCYLSEKTVWGFPSGEDQSQLIIFAIKGSIVHIIPSIEGIYIMQINPCIIENLCNLDIDITKFDKDVLNLIKEENINDLFRGLIIHIIEVYFRSTHIFRCKEFLETQSFISPIDFIKFSNAFELNNIFTTNDTNIKGCGNLNCNAIWVFERKIYKQTSFQKYVDDYESDLTVYSCKKNGNLYSTSIKLHKLLKYQSIIDTILNLNLGYSCKFPKDFWHNKWFKFSFSPNKVYYNNSWSNYISPNLSIDDKWNILKNISKASNDELKNLIKHPQKSHSCFFYYFNFNQSCTFNDISNILSKKIISNKNISHKNISHKNILNKNILNKNILNKNISYFSSNHKTSIIHKNKIIKTTQKPTYKIIGSSQCPHCITKKESLSQTYVILFMDFNTIKDAIEYIQQNIDKNISYIPIVIDIQTNTVLDI